MEKARELFQSQPERIGDDIEAQGQIKRDADGSSPLV